MTFPVELLLKCWFLAGPTASGKTASALCLAERIHAEIIALDSMTLYRNMDIGTAKPTSDERSRVRHHLIDILDPQDEFSLADYLSAAEVACRDVISRGRIPLFVGGTGLYLRGMLRGVFAGPSANWSVRARLEELSRSGGPQSLHDRLRRIDADSANRLHPNDQRRVIRALEVFELTGQPMSALQQQGARPIEQQPTHVYWLSPPRELLYRRIDRRVEQMLADGLVDEVRRLVDRPQSLSHTARQALGYKEVIEWLEAESMKERLPGLETHQISTHIALGTLTQSIQTRTRQFAKRQHTWFRNLEECRSIPVAGDESPDQIADIVLRTSESLAKVSLAKKNET